MLKVEGEKGRHLMELIARYKMEMERKVQLHEFHKMINIPPGVQDQRARTLHIVFIGSPGVGKSSVINSIITAISREGKYNEWSLVGSSKDGKSITSAVKRYPKEYYLWRETDFLEYNYPTLVDVPGLCENDDAEFQKELLRLIFFGKLTEEDSYEDIFRYYQKECDRYKYVITRDGSEENIEEESKQYGLSMLSERYLHHQSHYKIDRVVVVSTCMEIERRLERLVETVKSVCLSEKRKIPLYGILTHRDKDGPSYEHRKKEFKQLLGISEHRLMSCICHCDEYAIEVGGDLEGGTFPELDVPFLKFMKSVCNPTRQISNDEAIYTGQGRGLLVKITQTLNHGSLFHVLIFGAIFLLFVGLLYKQRSFRNDDPPDHDDNNTHSFS